MNKTDIAIIDELLKVIRQFEEFDFLKKVSEIHTEEFIKRVPDAELHFRSHSLLEEIQNNMEYDLGLINYKGGNLFALTERGKRAKELGGLDKLLMFERQQREERIQKEKQQAEVNQSVIDTNKSVIATNEATNQNYKIQKRLTIAAILVAGASFLSTLIGLLKDDSKELKQLNILLQRHTQTQDSMLQIIQRGLLFHPKDSLKKNP